MGKIVRLTESDLVRLVKRVINEQSTNNNENWHFFADLKSQFIPKGFVEDKMANTYGVLQLTKGDDYNGIVIGINTRTGECNWAVSKNGKYIVNKNYQINYKDTNNVGREGKKVFDMIVKDITPYAAMKFTPTQNRG